MPLSFEALQVYDHYLTTYQNKKKSNYGVHDYKSLKKLYSDIQRNNQVAPTFLNPPTSDDLMKAINLKEQACQFKQSMENMSQNKLQNMFVKRNPFSSNENLCTVTCIPNQSMDECPHQFEFTVASFATPQTNISSFLPASQEIMVEEGNYAFDLQIHNRKYELQFSIANSNTHKFVQDKIANLINKASIGLVAETIEEPNDPDRTALQISSVSTGKFQEQDIHFALSDHQNDNTNGIVNYLGLNHEIRAAQNALIQVGDDVFSSYNNEFDLYDNYHLTLHPENTVFTSISSPIKIGICPDTESISQNLKDFTDSYNDFSQTLADQKELNPITKEFFKEATYIKKHLENCGITLTPDNKLAYEKRAIDEENSADIYHSLEELQNFTSLVNKKIDQISMDPLRYNDHQICIYKNPNEPFVNPYETGAYTGLLFHAYV